MTPTSKPSTGWQTFASRSIAEHITVAEHILRRAGAPIPPPAANQTPKARVEQLMDACMEAGVEKELECPVTDALAREVGNSNIPKVLPVSLWQEYHALPVEKQHAFYMKHREQFLKETR